MKSLHNRVNIVPVIAKADTLTRKEISRLKKRILDEIAKHNIKIYQLPDVEEDEEEDYKEQTRVLKVCIRCPSVFLRVCPLESLSSQNAIMSSNDIIDIFLIHSIRGYSITLIFRNLFHSQWSDQLS